MRHRRQWYSVILPCLAVFFVVFLVACAGPTPTPTAAPAQPTATKPAATPVPAQPTATKPSGTPAAAPKIPHPLEGRSDCLLCHATGVSGAKAVPADHAGRTSDTCNTCHKPAQ